MNNKYQSLGNLMDTLANYRDVCDDIAFQSSAMAQDLDYLILDLQEVASDEHPITDVLDDDAFVDELSEYPESNG